MNTQSLGEGITAAEAGDGSYEGSRKLYLLRSLKMTPLERLQAIAEMGEAAIFIQRAAGTYGTMKRLRDMRMRQDASQETRPDGGLDGALPSAEIRFR